MDPVPNNTAAVEVEPWMPPKHLLWRSGRTYSIEEGREALVLCFRHLLGDAACDRELQSGGFGVLIKNDPSRPFSESTLRNGLDYLKQRAGSSCDPKVILRSMYRLKFVLNNLGTKGGLAASSVVEDGPGKVYMIACENDIATAREGAMRMSQEIGFSLTQSTSMATAVSELSRNILHYAGEGRISLNCINKGEKRGLKIRATDSGPGIENIEEVLSGNYVSRTGMGLGLLGTKRLLDDFSVDTTPGNGTKVTGIKYVR